MGRLLSVETGYSCNSRCGFCHQVPYRQTPGAVVDLTTTQIKEKIDWGARNGYDELGLSGGEVTIRPDAVDLIAFAREKGFRRIGLTTNGRMFAIPAFARRMVAAGLSTVSFSIHGHTAALHDMMEHTPGAFDQAMAGIDNVRAAATQLRQRVDLMSMSLAAPMNIDHFPDIIRLLGGKGFRLHMLQPFIVNEDSLEVADRFMVGYDRIEQALRAGIEAARPHDGKVKLYNIPPCLLRDVADRIDGQKYDFDVFSKHDKRAADEMNEVPWGFYRIPACRDCPDAWICHGFRREYYPEDKLLGECAEVLTTAPGADGTLWIGGTEVISAPGIKRLVADARKAGATRIGLATSGTHRLGKSFYAAAAEGGADEVVLVAQWKDSRGIDPRIVERGNAARLRTALERALPFERNGSLQLALAFGLQDLLAPEAAAEIRALRAAGLRRFYVGVSYAAHHVDAVTGLPRETELLEAEAILSGLLAEGGDYTFVDRKPPPGCHAPEASRRRLMALLPVIDGNQLWPETRLTSVDYYFITWSIPHWAMVPVRRERPKPAAEVPSGPPASVRELIQLSVA